MSKYTKEAPFEFEGVKVYDTGEGVHVINPGGNKWIGGGLIGRALHAFIETERDADQWHWTNGDHTEARKGRWIVEDRANEQWGIWHDDFGGGALVFSDSEHRTGAVNVAPRQMLREFLAWKAAQDQPDEPTGLGAVVEVEGQRYVRVTSPSWAWRFEGPVLMAFEWAHLTARGPVAVLSPGVES